MFCKRYVDDTLVLAKPSDNEYILNTFNTFDSQIQFTVDKFPDNDIHFLDIQILRNGTTFYRKPTHTGQYQHFSSYTWIRAVIHRELLKVEMGNIASRAVTKALIGGGGGVHIHIFAFCPTNFF